MAMGIKSMSLECRGILLPIHDAQPWITVHEIFGTIIRVILADSSQA